MRKSGNQIIGGSGTCPAFVHKEMTKYLCETKDTRYYVVKKKLANKIIKDLYSSNKYKDIPYA
jgi:hypothetical protein